MTIDQANLADLAFHGLVADPTDAKREEERLQAIQDAENEADLLDALDWDEHLAEDHFDEPDRDYEPDERLAWGGMDVPS